MLASEKIIPSSLRSRRNELQRDGLCWLCQLKHLSRPDVTKLAISSKVYVKAQNKRNPSSVVVSFLLFKMENESDLVGFALTAAFCPFSMRGDQAANERARH